MNIKKYFLSKKILIEPDPKKPVIKFDNYIDLNKHIIGIINLTLPPLVFGSISPASDDAIGDAGSSGLLVHDDHKHPAQGVSADAGNLIGIGTNGLHFLDATALISTDAGNSIMVGTDGRLVSQGATSTISYNALTGIMTHNDGAIPAVITNMDISADMTPFDPTGSITSIQVQAAIEEIQGHIENANNGLNWDATAQAIQLGGPLTEITQIDVDDTTNFTMISTIDPSNYLFFDDSSVDISSSASRISFGGSMNIFTPSWYGSNTYTSSGKLLQNINAVGGDVDFTSYAFPMLSGNNGEFLISNGTDLVFGNINTIINATNGLTLNTASIPNLIELGGVLNKDTTINTTNGFIFQINDAINTGITLNGITQLVSIESLNTAIQLDPNRVIIKTNTYSSAINGTSINNYETSGKIFQNIDSATGQFDVTPYDFPLTSGTVGQELVIDGANHVTWRTRPEIVSMQEFLVQEPLIVRDGESLWAVATDLNGWQLQNIKSVVSSTGSDSFTFDFILGGVTTPLTHIANSQVTDFTIAQTVAADDILQLNVTSVGASVPSGWTIIMTFNRIA